MKIHLRYPAILNISGFANNGEAEIPAGSSIAGLLTAGGITAEQQRYLLCYVNGEKKHPATVLREGDALQLLLPAGGG